MQVQNKNLPTNFPEIIPVVTIDDYSASKVTTLKKIINFIKSFISIFVRNICVFTTNATQMSNKVSYHCNLNKNIRFFRGDITKNTKVGVLASPTTDTINKKAENFNISKSMTTDEITKFTVDWFDNCLLEMQEKNTNILTVYMPSYPETAQSIGHLDYNEFVKLSVQTIDKCMRTTNTLGLLDKPIIVNYVVPSKYDAKNHDINNKALESVNEEVAAQNLVSVATETSEFIATTYTNIKNRSVVPATTSARMVNNQQGAVNNNQTLSSAASPKPAAAPEKPPAVSSNTDAFLDVSSDTEDSLSLIDNLPDSSTNIDKKPLTEAETAEQKKIEELMSEFQYRKEITFLYDYIENIKKSLTKDEIAAEEAIIDAAINNNKPVAIGSACVNYGDISKPSKLQGMEDKQGFITLPANDHFGYGGGACCSIFNAAFKSHIDPHTKRVSPEKAALMTNECKQQAKEKFGSERLKKGSAVTSASHELKSEAVLSIIHAAAPNMSATGNEKYLKDLPRVPRHWLSNSYISIKKEARSKLKQLKLDKNTNHYVATTLLGGAIFGVPPELSFQGFFIAMLLDEQSGEQDNLTSFLTLFNTISSEMKTIIATYAAVYKKIKNDHVFQDKFKQATAVAA